MLDYIKGKLVYKGESYIVVEQGGLGYHIKIATNSPIFLLEIDTDIQVYTLMVVKEDAINVFGFESIEEKEIFLLLTSVNGVGGKGALSIIGAMPLIQLKKAIIYEDINLITKANGIGKKTAQRIVLELKDKIEKISVNTNIKNEEFEIESIHNFNHKTEVGRVDEALEALVALGYNRIDAMKILDILSLELGNEATVEEYIKRALQGI